MKLEMFFEKFEQFAETPNAVMKVRELILQLAVQGKLVEQNSNETHAEETLRQVTRTVRLIAVNDEAKVPTGWVSIPLGCVIGSNTGGGTPSKQNPSYWNGSIPWASVKDIQTDKYLTATIDTITEEGLKNSSSNLIPPNCLLVVTRMGLGKLAINKIPVAINQDLRAIEPNEALALDFAYLLFKSLKLVGKGVTVKGITIEELHSTFIALPPLAEQKRIVAKVDELMALCDRLETQQRERNARHATLARASLARFTDAPTPENLNLLFHPSYAIAPADLRKTILTIAVQGKLVPQNANDELASGFLERNDDRRAQKHDCAGTRKTKGTMAIAAEDLPFAIPGSWAWRRLEEVADKITDGEHLSPVKTTSGMPLLTATHVTSRGVTLERSQYVAREDGQKCRQRCDPRRGDILICSRGTIGRCAVVETDEIFCLMGSVILVRFPAESCPKYFNYFLSTDLAQAEMLGMSGATAVQALYLKDIRQCLIPIPPLAEQRRIVAKVDQLIALVDQLETQLAASRATSINVMETAVAELTVQV